MEHISPALLFILRGLSADHQSSILSVIIIDLVFLTFSPFSLSSCPQTCHATRSNMEGLINNRELWLMSFLMRLTGLIYLPVSGESQRRNFIRLVTDAVSSNLLGLFQSRELVLSFDNLLRLVLFSACFGVWGNYMLIKALDEENRNEWHKPVYGNYSQMQGLYFGPGETLNRCGMFSRHFVKTPICNRYCYRPAPVSNS